MTGTAGRSEVRGSETYSAAGTLDESLLDSSLLETASLDADEVDLAARTAPPEFSGAVLQLLRSAVTLQAEDLLRTIGALALEGRDVREWTGLVERDVRDLAFLASAAVAAGAQLPAGLDGGHADPNHPNSVIEGLLASHEALMGVLRQLATRSPDPRLSYLTRAVLERREEQATVLRALGAGQGLPKEIKLVHGALPKYQR